MTSLLSHIICNEHFILNAERTLFWEDCKTLIVADLHVGKTGHFRKSGINVPQNVYKDDLQRLLAQILFFKAERLIIVGDLTHSAVNKEMDLFRRWRKDFSSLQVDLVRGNHDILEKSWYRAADIHVHDEVLVHGPFTFMHDYIESNKKPGEDTYTFSGHIHPVVHLKGKGRQAFRLPCFYFSSQHAVLPAFSRFTGGYKVDVKKGDSVFAITGKEIMDLTS